MTESEKISESLDLHKGHQKYQDGCAWCSLARDYQRAHDPRITFWDVWRLFVILVCLVISFVSAWQGKWDQATWLLLLACAVNRHWIV